MNSENLANLIKIIHYLVLFLIFVPPLVSKNTRYLQISISLSIWVLFRWITNNNQCELTVLEARLRGIKRSKGLIYQIISNIVEIREHKFNYILYAILGSWIIYVYSCIKKINPSYTLI